MGDRDVRGQGGGQEREGQDMGDHKCQRRCTRQTHFPWPPIMETPPICCCPPSPTPSCTLHSHGCPWEPTRPHPQSYPPACPSTHRPGQVRTLGQLGTVGLPRHHPVSCTSPISPCCCPVPALLLSPATQPGHSSSTRTLAGLLLVH